MIPTQNSSHLTIKESATVKPAKVQKQDLPIPFTPPWIVRRLRNDSLDESLTTLRTWMTHKRHQEIGKDLIQDITKLPDEEASKAVESLAGPKKFITGVKGNELMLPIQLQIPSSGKRLAAKALFDSGCTGSCINRDFVEKHEIPTQKTPLPLRVYNADGTLNGSGSITKFVEV